MRSARAFVRGPFRCAPERSFRARRYAGVTVLMARARGLPRRRVVWNHAFRSILPPVLTILLLALPGVVSGAVITETVFSLHGAGRFLLEATNSHDYPSAGAAFFLLALLTVGCNLLADLLYVLVDPRVRRESAR